MIKELLKQRILILDGAMGTMIQRYNLTEEDYRGNLFTDSPVQLKGNNDLLCLTKPEIITQIHEAYLNAGADIIETNTFNATSISMSDYQMQSYVSQINKKAAELAKEAARKYTKSNPSKPRFVAGSIGPTNKTCSISPDVNDPAFRALTYDDLVASYREQITALLESRVDLLLIETIFDTLNAKAALYAAQEAMQATQCTVPIMLSVTLSDRGGRTLSGQTLDAFLASISHTDILSVGLNCSFGARDMKPFLKQLSETAPYYISAYPNAGLPNRFGEYDETPETMAAQIKEYIDERLVNIIGGCCGTTPDHIGRYQTLIQDAVVRKPVPRSTSLQLSGLERLEVSPEKNFVNVGERCNVAGSRKFLRLIKEKKYDEALQIARQQVEDGAQILDINMDDAMLDARQEMTHFLNLIASEPDIARLPIMVDSSKWEVIVAGLKCIQGKSIVNSISLKEGETVFLEHARMIKQLGAAIVVMAFDEKGQADTFERKIEVCRRAYNLLVQQAGIDPNDIIFDPNVLAIATGIEEHLNYGVDFIRATRWIKENLPGAKVSGGVSNLSFSFRGNNYIREALHAVFLYHAIAAGMDMGIVNPSSSVTYSDIPADTLTVIEDVLFNRKEDATERLIALAEKLKEEKNDSATGKVDEWAALSLDERLQQALIKGRSDTLEEDLHAAIQQYGKAVKIIDGPLMKGMNRVGELFGAGKMFLPQVVKTARTMKQAVAILQPFIEAEKDSKKSTTAGKFLLATVKGDVHDIGKNIVAVVLVCNNFEVIDMGVMVPTNEIVQKAIDEKVDFVGLSGLITPSLEEMCAIADEMQKAHLTIPLMIGGATTSDLHTAVKIAPRYDGPVIHVKDASQNPVIAATLMNPASRETYLSKLQTEQEQLRQSVGENIHLLPLEEAEKRKISIDWSNYTPVIPRQEGLHIYNEISIKEARKFINWKYFFKAWRLSGEFSSIASLHGCDHCKASWLASFDESKRAKASEAMQLYKEASRCLDILEQNEQIQIKAIYRFSKANSDGQNIVLPEENITIPCLRQQSVKENEKISLLSLADFVAPASSGITDYIGSFAVTTGKEIEELIEKQQHKEDNYQAILLQSLSDRIVEAATELLHYRIRTDFWGYVPNEASEPERMLQQKYQGIRPAVGYPSLPDQSLMKEMNQLLQFEQIGIFPTENGALRPSSSVTGLMIAHPQSSYFMVGKIGDDQRRVYSRQRGFSLEESSKWLSV